MVLPAVVCLVVVVLLGGLRGISRAGESDDLITKGVELRRKGEDEKALELFKRAHDADHGARSGAQMGLAEQALGIWNAAEVHLTQALGQRDDPWIKKNRIALQKALDTVALHLGTLDVWGSPAGAEVVIGGTSAGVLPLSGPVRVTAGTVQLSVRANGYLELARVVDVPAGGKVRERFELPRLARKNVQSLSVAADPAPASGSDSGPAGAGKPSLVALRSDPAEPAETSRSVWKTWWLWTIVGAVAVAGGVTAFLLTRPGDCLEGAKCGTIAP